MKITRSQLKQLIAEELTRKVGATATTSRRIRESSAPAGTTHVYGIFRANLDQGWNIDALELNGEVRLGNISSGYEPDLTSLFKKIHERGEETAVYVWKDRAHGLYTAAELEEKVNKWKDKMLIALA